MIALNFDLSIRHGSPGSTELFQFTRQLLEPLPRPANAGDDRHRLASSPLRVGKHLHFLPFPGSRLALAAFGIG